MLQCRMCKCMMLTSHFGRDKNQPDGLNRICKLCARTVIGKPAKLNKTKWSTQKPERTGTKKCGKCKEQIPKSDFNLDRKSNDGLAWRCRSCVRLARKASHHTSDTESESDSEMTTESNNDKELEAGEREMSHSTMNLQSISSSVEQETAIQIDVLNLFDDNLTPVQVSTLVQNLTTLQLNQLLFAQKIIDKACVNLRGW